MFNFGVYHFIKLKLMKKMSVIILSMLASISFAQNTKDFYSLSTKTIDGDDFNFSQLKGKKVLIVNTASECGYTPQYADLEKLYQTYKDQNFVIIGFPANNFASQEPGSNQDIKSFCSKNYGVTFSMMNKIAVKGKDIDTVYKWLTEKENNGVETTNVSWNFNKFLIDEKGNYIKHLKSNVKPFDNEIVEWIKK